MMTVICRKGLIYFPDFCQLALERMRETEAQVSSNTIVGAILWESDLAGTLLQTIRL